MGAMIRRALAAAAIMPKLTKEDCTSLPELVERSRAMASDIGQRQPVRGIRLQMLERALRVLREEMNVTAANCSVTSRPRRFCDDDCEGRAPTMLWTFPGSGNTYTRALIEASTSIHTGSVFYDEGLGSLLPGEKEPLKTLADCQRVAVIKAHPNVPVKTTYVCSFPVFNICGHHVTKVVIVTRHPFSAAWAEFQRRFAQKEWDGIEEHKEALTDVPENEWLASWATVGPMLVNTWGNMWRSDGQYTTWMAAYGDESFLITRFEDLVNPEARQVELRHTITFIGLSNFISDTSIACAFDSELAGSFRRSGRHRRLQPLIGNIVESVDSESASAHWAWLALKPQTREDAWLRASPFADALGYSINATDYKLHWNSQ